LSVKIHILVGQVRVEDNEEAKYGIDTTQLVQFAQVQIVAIDRETDVAKNVRFFYFARVECFQVVKIIELDSLDLVYERLTLVIYKRALRFVHGLVCEKRLGF
jgi:hypothetical protein